MVLAYYYSMFGITLAMSLVYVFIFHKHFARIMAIADVYDALVSKRAYKERMSFEETDRIIMDGMGNTSINVLRSSMSSRVRDWKSTT